MDDRRPVGICCSGGGIRAAAYTIGCLQVLDTEGVLRGPQGARFISAVSGGSYAVGAAAIIQHGLESGDGSLLQADSGPYSPSSPELQHLRDRLHYLTHAPGGLPSELWRVFMGVVMNLLLFAAAAMLLGYVSGWIYGWSFPQLRIGSTETSVHPSTWVVVVAVALGAAALVIGLVWVAHRWVRTLRLWQWAAVGVAVSAAVWTIVALLVPQLLAWLHRATVAGHAHAADPASGGVRHYWIPLGGLIGVLGAVGAAVGPVWRELSATGATGDSPGFLAKQVAKFRRPVMNLVTMLAVPALFGGLLVAFMYNGSSQPVLVAGTSGWQWLGAVIPLVVLTLAWFFSDLNSWSLHTIYKERLGDAFNLERVPRPPDPGSGQTPERLTTRLSNTTDTRTPATTVGVARRTEPLPLSDLELEHFPTVLICATSNITDYGLVPTARNAAPFLLSARKVGGPVVEKCSTGTYAQVGLGDRNNLTVMDAVSISGAAVAPEMGKMTRRPYRFLLALANIRLGVWMPKPSKVLDRLNRRGLLLQIERESTTDSNRALEPEGETPRSATFDGTKVATNSGASSKKRVRPFPPPGVKHLLNEAFLRDLPGSRFLYVTDGGHYDNLGLVELLERRCAWIWCIDASGDNIDSFDTLGQALALASELGVHIDIKPEAMAPRSATPRLVRQPFCTGKIRYPDRNWDGVLVVVKAGVPATAPWSVLAYHAANPNFPCDPTTNQLYDASRFDAYVALGNYAMSEATGVLSDRYGEFLQLAHQASSSAGAV